MGQLAVEEHADRIEKLVQQFASQVSREVDVVLAQVLATSVSTLAVSNGTVNHSPKNARRVLSLSNEFEQVLERSAFYPTVYAFVSSFTDQVDEFSNFYQDMRLGTGLSDMNLSDGDMGILSNQAAAAVSTLEGRVLRISSDLRHFLSKSLGESKVPELVGGISDIIRKLSNVEPIARDQLMSFFRIVGSLVYKNLEAFGHQLKFLYVGPLSESSRDFCRRLTENTRTYTRQEIDGLENRQIHSVFDNAGGWGCRHWWAIAEAA